jgi:hypothetical protein
MILEWADAHFQKHGKWPKTYFGSVDGYPGERWSSVNVALQKGGRGLLGGTSLPKLLRQMRGVPNPRNLPELTTQSIIIWAEAYRAKYGRWPTTTAGKVEDGSGGTWQAINTALSKGGRGLPGGSSLKKVLEGAHPASDS